MEMSRRQFVTAVAVCAAGACLCGNIALGADTTPSTADIGTLADYPAEGIIDKFAKSHRIMIVRGGGRIHATSATCTHKENLVRVKDGVFVCPAHGSRFDIDGKVTRGPSSDPLPRFGISINDQGHIIVDKTKSFSQNQWNEQGSWIAV